MPCNNGGGPDFGQERIVYRNGVDPAKFNTEIDALKRTVNSLEAGLCAIISELENSGMAQQYLLKASSGGLIDLVGFWAAHKKDDVSRIAKKLSEFSEHEQKILRNLLNKEL